MIIEGPRRIPCPEWAVYALLAGLYAVTGNAMGFEIQFVNVLGTTVVGQFGGRA